MRTIRSLSTAIVLGTTLALTGCTATSADDDETSAPTETETAQNAASLSVEQMQEVLLPVESTFGAVTLTDVEYDGIGKGTAQPVSEVDFTMSYSLDGVTPAADCQALVDEVNAFSTPGSAMVFGAYELEFDANSDVDSSSSGPLSQTSPPSIQSAVVDTFEEQDVMEVYTRLAQTCEGVHEGDNPGITATFSQIGDLDVAKVLLATPMGDLIMHAGGKSVGHHHVYVIMLQINDDDVAEQLYNEAIHRLEEAVAQLS